MCVIDSKGSSPGRMGFKMAVNEDGELLGSIGGGIMEHKLVELCKSDLLKKDFDPFIKRQIHQSNIPKDKSGMICSGEQTIAFYELDNSYNELIGELVNWSGNGALIFSEKGIRLNREYSIREKFDLKLKANSWSLIENLNYRPTIHIIGGGHVGLALSELAHALDFEVKIYDDREKLNTLDQNQWAEQIPIPDYSEIKSALIHGMDDYVVLMSFGYQTDKILLKELVQEEFHYLGMMGSSEKVKKLFGELISEGITNEHLSRVHAPIGIPIASKTPKEIAISILAEIIQVKNS